MPTPATKPLFVTFVVATFNCVERVPVLRRTVDLLRTRACEFCVSDGGSTDGTLAALEAIEGLRIVRTGPDLGIYDAWNYALEASVGRYVSFIGVDDQPCARFIDNATSRFSSDCQPSFVYGDALLKRGNKFRRVVAPRTPRLFEAQRPKFDVPHPGALNHARMFAGQRFSPGYRLAGDLEFYVRAREEVLRHGYVRLDTTQAIVDADGVSRGPSAFDTYREEYARIEADLNTPLDYSLHRLRALSLLRHAPWLFEAIRSLSWSIRGRSFGDT